MQAHAPQSKGGFSVDDGEEISLIKYVPSDAQRTVYLKADKKDNGQSVNVTETVQDGASSVGGYYLGWKADEAHLMTLPAIGPNDWFFTAKMNGCCVYVGGDAGTPTVIHANTASDKLEDIEFENGTPIEEKMRLLADHQQALYRKIYAKLAQKFQEHGHLTGNNISVFDPPNYRLLNGYEAYVFGRRKNGNWTFYCCYERQSNGAKSFITHELWPNFELPS